MASDFEVTIRSKRISQSVMRTDYNWFTEYVKLFKTETVAKNVSILPSIWRVLSNGLSKIEVDLQTQPYLELWILKVSIHSELSRLQWWWQNYVGDFIMMTVLGCQWRNAKSLSPTYCVSNIDVTNIDEAVNSNLK